MLERDGKNSKGKGIGGVRRRAEGGGEPWKKSNLEVWKKQGEAVIFMRERANSLRLRKRQGEQVLERRTRKR